FLIKMLFDGTACSFYDVFLCKDKHENRRDNHDYRNAQHWNNGRCMYALEGCKTERKCVLRSVLQENQWSKVVVPYGEHVQNSYHDQTRSQDRHEDLPVNLERVRAVQPRRFFIILRNSHEELPHQEDSVGRY